MRVSDQLSFPQNQDERAEERQRVDYAGTVRELGSVARAVRLVDISRRGCRLKGDVAGAGEEVWIRIGALAPLRGRVIWRSGAECGCCFYEPLSRSQILALKSDRASARATLFVQPLRTRFR